MELKSNWTASPKFPDLPKNFVESIKEFSIKSKTLRVRRWSREGVGSRMIIVHGFGENANRYRHWPFFLGEQVKEFLSIDLPGHGLSDGPRGDCQSFSEMTAAIEAVISAIVSDGKPLVLFGHSFGGLSCLKWYLDQSTQQSQSKLKRMIISAPLLKLAIDPPAIKVKLASFIAPFMGHLSMKNEIPLGTLSRDPLVIQNYIDSPLNHNRITPRMFLEMTEAMNQVLSTTKTFNLSTDFILGLSDQLVDARCTWKWVTDIDKASPARLRINSFPGLFHESCNDIDKELVFNSLRLTLSSM